MALRNPGQDHPGKQSRSLGQLSRVVTSFLCFRRFPLRVLSPRVALNKARRVASYRVRQVAIFCPPSESRGRELPCSRVTEVLLCHRGKRTHFCPGTIALPAASRTVVSVLGHESFKRYCSASSQWSAPGCTGVGRGRRPLSPTRAELEPRAYVSATGRQSPKVNPSGTSKEQTPQQTAGTEKVG